MQIGCHGSLAVALPTCALDERLDDLHERWRSGEPWCAVVDAAGVVLGRLRRRQLDGRPGASRVREVMDEGPSTYRPSLPARELPEHMERGRFTRALVTEAGGRLLGIVERTALDSALDAGRDDTGGC